jgi:inner membrane transporter RhtA
MTGAARSPGAALAVVGSVVSLSVGTSLAKRLFPVIGAEGTTFVRVGLATLLLLALHRPWRHWPTPRTLLAILAYGSVLGAMNLLFYLSLRTLPFGIAVAIEFSGPLAVALCTSRRALDVLWIALAMLGMALLLPLGTHTGRLDPSGVALALSAAACWALYILIGRHAGASGGGQAVSLGLLVAALLTAPFGALRIAPLLQDVGLLACAGAMAVLSSALPFSLEMYALRRLPTQVFGTLLSLEPAVSALAAWLLLAEQLAARQWAAIACIVAASAGTALTRNH